VCVETSSVSVTMSSEEGSFGSNVASANSRAVRFAQSLRAESPAADALSSLDAGQQRQMALAKLATASLTKAKPRIPFVRSDSRYKEIKEELARKAKKRQTQEIIQE